MSVITCAYIPPEIPQNMSDYLLFLRRFSPIVALANAFSIKSPHFYAVTCRSAGNKRTRTMFENEQKIKLHRIAFSSFSGSLLLLF